MKPGYLSQIPWYFIFIFKTAILEDTAAYDSLEEIHSTAVWGHLYLENVPTSSAGWSLSMSGAGFCCLKISRTLSHTWSYSNSAPTIAMNMDPTMIATPTWWSWSAFQSNSVSLTQFRCAKIFMKYSRQFPEIITKFFRIFPKIFRNFSEIFLIFFRYFSEIFLDLFWNFSEIFPKFSRNFS